jgi:hypothetical protein
MTSNVTPRMRDLPAQRCASTRSARLKTQSSKMPAKRKAGIEISFAPMHYRPSCKAQRSHRRMARLLAFLALQRIAKERAVRSGRGATI